MARLLLIILGAVLVIALAKPIWVFWRYYQLEKSMEPLRAKHAREVAEEEAINNAPAETDPARWRKLLQDLSDLAIADEDIREELTPQQIHNGWLGEAPATEAEIASAEQRLGFRLPPSYRAFLKVSNGWHYPNSFIARVAGTREIGFTRDIAPELIKAWNQGYDADEVEKASGREWPEKHLAETLLVNVPSDFDDAAELMLNPATIKNGEMEAWFFSSWNPGAAAYPSFWHLMAAQERNWPRSMPAKSLY